LAGRAFPYVASRGFAVAAIDAPGTGDRPEHPQIRRLVAEIQERKAAGEPVGCGAHQEVPSFEIDSSVRFFARHLGTHLIRGAG